MASMTKQASRYWREQVEHERRRAQEVVNETGRTAALLRVENARLAADIRKLNKELADLHRLCTLQQRRIDGYEAEYGPPGGRM